MESNGDIVYETLDAISLFSNPDPENDLSDSYAVFRNQITSSTDLSTVIPVVDYFSLNVLADTPRREIQEISPLTSVDRSNEGCNASELAWFRAASRFKSPMIQLHKEILDFCDFVSPTPEEQSSRAAAMQGVVEVVKCIWPHCKVEVFGSFRTGLYIPTSDIDVVVFESRVRTPQIGLYALAKALSQRNIAKKMQVISKARVPIIKFVEKQSGIAFDISFDIDGGPKAADFIKDAVRKLPPLRPLCLILKVFLHQRELNEVYSGGIGSYTLLAMLIAHLQLHWRGQDIQRCQKSMEHNLGILLVGISVPHTSTIISESSWLNPLEVSFLDFYGCKLNTLDVGVSCNLPGTFFLKTDKGFLNAKRPRLLSVEDPQAPDNDIARNSFNYYKVRTAFSMAYARLTDAKAITGSSSHKSILGTIIRPDPLLLNRRGGTNGELTFVDLLPGADESPSRQFGDEINGDGNLLSSRKRKAKREKRKMRKSFDGGEALDRVNEANGTTQTRSAKKKRRRRAFQEHDERFFKSVPRYSSRSRRSVTVIQLTGKRTTMRI